MPCTLRFITHVHRLQLTSSNIIINVGLKAVSRSWSETQRGTTGMLITCQWWNSRIRNNWRRSHTRLTRKCCLFGNSHGEGWKEICNDDEHLPLRPCNLIAGEKRKPSEPLPYEENKRPRVVGDIPMDLINEVMATIADPAAIPEVTNKSRNHLSNNQLADSQVVFG